MDVQYDITSSQAQYLSMIQYLHEQLSIVRRVDIATALGYSKASVTKAVQHLQEQNYVEIHNSNIKVSKQGKVLLQMIQDRHDILRHCLLTIGFQEYDACLYASLLILQVDEGFIHRLCTLLHTSS